MKTAKYFLFMPFKKRECFLDDKVVGIKLSGFSNDDLEAIKYCKNEWNDYYIDKDRMINSCGGWIPEHKCWFFEIDMFEDHIKVVLENLGFNLYEIEDPTDVIVFR